MPFMTRLAADLVAFGFAPDFVPGWDRRGASSFSPRGVVCHWTGGPRATTGRPSLAVVTNGRPGLPGPLCNVYLDRRGVPVLVAAGRANHAGAGGWRGLSGNSSVYGIEAEAAGDGDWTPEMREAYPRLVAAMLHGIDRDASWACGHNEWAPARKIDIRDWPLSGMRAEVSSILADPSLGAAPTVEPPAPDPQGDDDMPTIVKSNDGTFYLIHPLGVQTLTSMAQVTPWTAMGVKVTDLVNGDITQIRGVVDALRKQLVDQTAAEVARRLGGSVQVDEQQIAEQLAPLLHGLTDLDIERVRDAGVEAIELSKGVVQTAAGAPTGEVIRFTRAAQG